MPNLFEEHNSACERAHLSSCSCYCHGAGHQFDLIKRAVTCRNSGTNNLTKLLDDLHDIYGGFHNSFTDTATKSRRTVKNLGTASPNTGRGATWRETLLVDEALHAMFIRIAQASTRLNSSHISNREAFVTDLRDGAFRVVGGSLGAKNICDGHLWCSIVVEAAENLPTIPTRLPATSSHGKICYPRESKARKPANLDPARPDGVSHIRNQFGSHTAVKDKDEILRLVGAAACPDLWHHPAAVRLLVGPFVGSSSWPPAGTTTIAVKPDFDVLESRWSRRGNW